MRFNAISHIKEFNLFRLETGKTKESFSITTLREGLKSCGLPLNSVFITELRKSGLLTKVSKEGYVWKSPDSPVHFKVLQTIYSNYHNRVSVYNSTRVEKTKLSDKSKREQINKAIELLKSEGYEIFMPLTNIYTKL